MKVVLGKDGLDFTFQARFPEEATCIHCGGRSRIGFVAHEKGEPIIPEGGQFLCQLHDNDPHGEGFWLHDACAVAIYFCRKCLKPTALYNQG